MTAGFALSNSYGGLWWLEGDCTDGIMNEEAAALPMGESC
jgi:hypothetical protein